MGVVQGSRPGQVNFEVERLASKERFVTGNYSPLALAVVVPCYDESDVLGLTLPRLLSLVDDLQARENCSEKSFVVFIDDGSTDDTWGQIENVARQHPRRVRGIRLSHNVGHQNALLAGLEYVADKCDAAVSIDADLQDDLAAIPTMIREFRNGAEIVLGVRQSREVDPWFKRTTALTFYKLMRTMGVDLVENHADFRLMSARVLRHLKEFSEYHLFLRGLTPLLHHRVVTVACKRAPRTAGSTKYPLGRMLSLAWNGITSFSVVPLRMISFPGGAAFAGSLVLATYAFLSALTGNTLPGWASITVPLYLLGGLIMLSVGIVGEYIGKVFLEVKRRPRFLVDAVLDGQAENARSVYR